MTKICQITGKRPMVGNHRSHAMNSRRRRFIPNLHTRRFWIQNENRFIKLLVSSQGMRLIDKKGIEAVLEEKLTKK